MFSALLMSSRMFLLASGYDSEPVPPELKGSSSFVVMKEGGMETSSERMVESLVMKAIFLIRLFFHLVHSGDQSENNKNKIQNS